MKQKKWLVWFGLIFVGLALIGCEMPFDPTSSTNAEVQPEPDNTPLPQVDSISAGSECGPVWQQQYIDAAFARYQEQRTAEVEAIAELTAWLGDVSAELAVRCNPSVAETTDPEQLALLLEKLQEGGYVIYVRHPHTDRSRGDTDVSLGQCDQQRVLSDRGRDEALLIRNAYQQLELPISQLISTQYCRTLETAVLAFGVPQVILRTELNSRLPDFLAAVPTAGTNVIIVAHIGTIQSAVGLDDTFEEGDSLVYQPDGIGGFDYVGRIGLYDWPLLAKLNGD